MTTEKNIIKHFFNTIHPHGGLTYCYKVIDNDVYVGIAYCSPKDIYSRKIGRKVAEANLAALVDSGENYLIKARFIIGFKANVADIIKTYIGTISYDEKLNSIILSVLNTDSFNDKNYDTLILNYSDYFSEMINQYHFHNIEQKLLDDGENINSCIKYWLCYE